MNSSHKYKKKLTKLTDTLFIHSALEDKRKKRSEKINRGRSFFFLSVKDKIMNSFTLSFFTVTATVTFLIYFHDQRTVS